MMKTQKAKRYVDAPTARPGKAISKPRGEEPEAEDAQEEGKGVVVVDGKLIENLHVEGAQRLIALADAIAELEGAVK